MLVVEDDVVLDERILELTFLEKQMPVFRISSAEASSVVVRLRYVQKLPVYAEMS